MQKLKYKIIPSIKTNFIKYWLLFTLCFTGFIFSNEQGGSPVERKIREVRVIGDAAYAFTPAISQRLKNEFLGKKISKKVLSDFKKAVLTSLREQGQFAIQASFPKQDISLGVIVLELSLSSVKSVTIKGNRWQTEEFYRKQLPLEPGETLKTPQLLDQLSWFNRNPFYYAEIAIAPSSEQTEVEVDFLVKDRFVFRPFVGADNTGTDLTNQVRLFAGANWGKPFGRPDLLTYQFISAPNPKQFYAHTINYLFFLPWKHELTFYGGYSVASPKMDPPSFSQEGRSVQASFRYAIPFRPLYKPNHQTFTWGFDYKNINSNVFFIDEPAIPIIAQQANISQFYLSYSWQNRFLFKLETLFSPFRWLPHQSDHRYDMLRAHSQAQYLYGRLALADTYGKPDRFSFSWTLRAQAATGPLLPSEQFGLGGYDTVRGYEERDFLADNAICINLELVSSRISFFGRDRLHFLAFSDFGAGSNYRSELNNQKSQYLFGAGLGLRYLIAPYLSLRADYGAQLHHIFGEDRFGHFHLGGSLSY